METSREEYERDVRTLAEWLATHPDTPIFSLGPKRRITPKELYDSLMAGRDEMEQPSQEERRDVK